MLNSSTSLFGNRLRPADGNGATSVTDFSSTSGQRMTPGYDSPITTVCAAPPCPLDFASSADCPGAQSAPDPPPRARYELNPPAEKVTARRNAGASRIR